MNEEIRVALEDAFRTINNLDWVQKQFGEPALDVAEPLRRITDALRLLDQKEAEPRAYCKACQSVGMSNCGNFDECGGPQCVTCHQPLLSAAPTAQKQPTEQAQPQSIALEAARLLPRLQSLSDRIKNDERSATMFEGDWDELQSAVRLCKSIKRASEIHAPTAAPVAQDERQAMAELIAEAHKRIEAALPEEEPDCVPDWVCELLIKFGMEVRRAN